jgi:F0F1-type ATP synthase alpha subunit
MCEPANKIYLQIEADASRIQNVERSVKNAQVAKYSILIAATVSQELKVDPFFEVLIVKSDRKGL